MQRVSGIGGVFFRAADPERLNRWYEQHLGVTAAPGDYDAKPWVQAAGPTVWAAFPASTQYFGRAEQQWMINFRVCDLDAMVRQLEAAGISVERDTQVYPNGIFARLQDPEGNPIQLWEPRGLEATLGQ